MSPAQNQQNPVSASSQLFLALLPRAVAPPLLQIFAFNIIHYKWQIIFQTSSEHIYKKKRLLRAEIIIQDEGLPVYISLILLRFMSKHISE